MKDYSKYLINEEPIFFLPTLAKTIGLNEAIMIQKIHGWLNCKPNDAEGRAWIYNTYKSWQEQLPFWSEDTIKRTLQKLVDKKIVIRQNLNKNRFDRTYWYSIDYDMLDEIAQKDVCKLLEPISASCTILSEQVATTYTNNNNNSNNNNIYIVEQIIDYMNNLAGTNFKKTAKKTISLINARLKEGFTLEDFKDVVYFKYQQWYKEPFKFTNGITSDTYFRPSTLFSTNFENYLQDYKNKI